MNKESISEEKKQKKAKLYGCLQRNVGRDIIVIIVTLYCHSQSSSVNHNILVSDELCPFLVHENRTVYCYCNQMKEIYCRHLLRIPRFAKNKKIYSAIYMDRQNIYELLQESFNHLSVKKIVLTLNPIGDRISAKAFSGLETILEELEIASCGIEYLPLGFLNSMVELRRLFLWRNRIERIPSRFFKDNSNLLDLILWGNNIEEIENDSFQGLSSIKKIDLDRNKISVINRNAFRKLSTLEALYIGENNIMTLHSDTFYHLANLKVLNIDHNQITFIYPKAFHGLNQLVSLDLDDNRISLLPDNIFSNLHNLTILSLKSNQLQHVWSKTFNGLWSLQTLNLSRNKLSNLQGGVFRQSSRLIHLGLDGNRLKTIERCVLSNETKLRTLSLIGNPIFCECNFAWVVQGTTNGNFEYSFREKQLHLWGSCTQILNGDDGHVSRQHSPHSLSRCTVLDCSI